VHLALALQLLSLPQRQADAALHAQEALRIRPDYAEAHNCLAIILAQQGRLGEARDHWERALQLNPGYETARENLSRLDQITRERPKGR
jgi:Flp pilus assembly protein TadD